MSRAEVLQAVAARLAARDPGHPLRVGIDGVCGSGKSRFADDLAETLAASGRTVIRLDSDGFHNLRAIRRRNDDPARGYYEDAYDFAALLERVLVPLGPDGAREYATRVHDLVTDDVLDDTALAPNDAVLLFDCTFLQRGDLRQHWEEVVYLDVGLDVAQSRGVARDAEALGGPDAAAAAYDTRYMAACRIYLAEQDPIGRAGIVIDHDDPADPRIGRR